MSDRISIRIPPSLKEKLNARSSADGMTLSKLVITAVELYLDDNLAVVEAPLIESAKQLVPYSNHPLVKTLKSDGITFYDDDGTTVLAKVYSVKELFDYLKTREI